MSFKETFTEEDCTDPMAQLLTDLSEISEYYRMVSDRFPRVMDILRKERLALLNEAEKRFSDLWSRIDVYKEGDEDSWVTAMRIIDHYAKTYNKALDGYPREHSEGVFCAHCNSPIG
ncbi:MAG: hypothetical protein BBJ57_07240 [Desulfobacterales bacterium PC51MH44]|nr:MAG: hypothetical protein BBJ57_07240 [Desulfobacterales bacterium PC51MH44]